MGYIEAARPPARRRSVVPFAALVADVVGNSRLAGTDEDRTLARLRDVSVSSSVFLAKPAEKEVLQ
jgi:hypothetical protein